MEEPYNIDRVTKERADTDLLDGKEILVGQPSNRLPHIPVRSTVAGLPK
jgi:hypothetical protein